MRKSQIPVVTFWISPNHCVFHTCFVLVFQDITFVSIRLSDRNFAFPLFTSCITHRSSFDDWYYFSRSELSSCDALTVAHFVIHFLSDEQPSLVSLRTVLKYYVFQSWFKPLRSFASRYNINRLDCLMCICVHCS